MVVLAAKMIAKCRNRIVAFLIAFASVQLLGTLFFCFYIPQTPGRMQRASTALFGDLDLWAWCTSFDLPLRDDPNWVAVLLLLATAAMFAVYALAILLNWQVPADRTRVTIVIGGAILSFVVSTFALPNINTDIFNYITRARVATVHDANPHYVPASAFPEDPVYPYASARIARIVGDKFSVWTWISMPLSRFAGDDPTANLMVFRSLFLLCNIGNVLLIFSILRRLSPEHAVAGTIFYAWNPIVLLLGQSKTDTVMVFFLVLGILWLVLRKHGLAIVSLTASVLIKLITLPLVVIYWLRELRYKRWSPLARSVLLFSAVVLLTYWPLWEGPELITSHLGVGLGEAGASSSASLSKALLLSGFAIFMVLFSILQKDDDAVLIKRWAIIMLLFGVFLARISNSWYLMTPIAIISLCNDWRITLAGIAVTFSAFLFNVWYSVSTSEFRLPEMFSNSRFMIFLIPVITIALIIIAHFFWKKLRNTNRAQKSEHAFSHEIKQVV